MNKLSDKTVLLFGSFDGIHRGHEYLINFAKNHGKNIILVVAQNEIIQSMKGRAPMYSIHKRISHLQEKFIDVEVVAGDTIEGAWSPIINFRPDTVIVGYDQEGLAQALKSIQEQYCFAIVTAPAFHPERYKSSLLRKNKNL